jgi:hypothetical protein
VALSTALARETEFGFRDFVPDSPTAVAIARAVLIPIYGPELVRAEEPLQATRQASPQGDIWVVTGTLHCNAPPCLGGTGEVKLSVGDGRIIHVTHYK